MYIITYISQGIDVSSMTIFEPNRQPPSGIDLLTRTELAHRRTSMTGRRQLLFLTTCSDDSKPYMIRVALIKAFQNHIGFAIIRASGEEK